MYIVIIDEKNPIEMYNLLKKSVKEKTFSPKVGMEILSHTNNPVIIKELVNAIEVIDKKERRKFKEVILSVVNGREQPLSVFEKCKKIAIEDDFMDNFDYFSKKEEGKVVLSSPLYQFGWYVDGGEYVGENFGGAKFLRFIDGKSDKYEFYGANDMPEIVDLSRVRGKDVKFLSVNFKDTRKIDVGYDNNLVFDRVSNLPDVDWEKCKYCMIIGSDLSHIKRLKVGRNATFSFSSMIKMPKVLDLFDADFNPMFLKDNFDSDCEVIFCEDDDVKFNGCQSLPKKLDFSRIRKNVDIWCSDAHLSDELFFGNKEKVTFISTSLPKTMDLSGCKIVEFKECLMSNFDNYKLKENCELNLVDASDFGEVVDVSMAKKVDFTNAHLDGVRIIKARNIYALKGLENALSFSGKIDIKGKLYEFPLPKSMFSKFKIFKDRL